MISIRGTKLQLTRVASQYFVIDWPLCIIMIQRCYTRNAVNLYHTPKQKNGPMLQQCMQEMWNNSRREGEAGQESERSVEELQLDEVIYLWQTGNIFGGFVR